MRYYRIEIGANPDAATAAGGNSGAVYTSQVGGKNDPGALRVVFDLPVTTFAEFTNNNFVRIWGVSLKTISQAANFNGSPISIYGGMATGLPLATEAFNNNQQGLLVSGTIYQAFGNWIGTDMTLDLNIISNGGATQADPANLVLDWKKGTPLGVAIQNTMATAFPAYTVNAEGLNQNLILGSDETAYYQTVQQFAAYLKRASLAIVGGTYNGVDITLRDKAFYVFDGTTPTSPTLLKYNDLIGQPTWVGPREVQFNCVLRADLAVGDYIKFPPTAVTTTAASMASQRPALTFLGSFNIVYIRHVGDSRQADGQSWITTVNAQATT